jgi:hypothetical protein
MPDILAVAGAITERFRGQRARRVFICGIGDAGSLMRISPEDSQAVPDPADEVGRSPGGTASLPGAAR